MATSSDIQYPRLKGEKQFQTFCLKLAQRYWKDGYAQLYARRGQQQYGVDITGSDHRNGYSRAGMQCKGAETNDPRQLSEKELISEVEKAKDHPSKLDVLVVAYAGNRDGPLQDKVSGLNEEHQKAGLFRVVLWSWDDITELALEFPDVIELLHVQNRVPTVSALDPKRPDDHKAVAFHAAMESAIATYESALPKDTGGASASDSVAEGKLDVFRDQIRAGQGDSVVEPLRNFIRSSPGSPHVRYRAYANLGAALIQQGQPTKAVIAFDEAADAEPGTAGSHAYKALSALLREKNEIAHAEAEKALELDPHHELAGKCLIEASPDDVPSAEIEQRLSSMVSKLDIAASLAHRYSDQDAHEDASRIARQIRPDGWQRDVVIAQAILGRFENNLEARLGAPLKDFEQELLDEARDLLERAWEHVRQRGDRQNWPHVGGNLCAAYRLTGKNEEADVVALEAHDMAPDSEPLIEQATLAYIHRRQFRKAKMLAETLAENGASEDASLAAMTSASAESWEDAEKWATKVLNESNNGSLRARTAEILITSIQKREGAEEALNKADSIRTTFEPNIAFESRVAEIARRVGDKEKLSLAQERLSAFDSAELNPIERFELAAAFADEGNWSRAAELLENLHTLDRPSEILEKRLFALYRADQRAKARDLYNSLQAGALRSVKIRRLGAAIFERSGMLSEASKELEAALALDSSDLSARLDWARLCIRNSDEPRVSRWARKASIDAHGEPEELLELAQLLDRYNRRKDALRLGYHTLLKNWGKSERLHTMYMSLFLVRPRKERYLLPKKIAQDAVVFLENEHGGTARYCIEADAEPASDRLAPDHPFAQKLLGLKVGDTVTQSEGIGQPSTWKITEIKHKYVDLFQRALDTHETAFPGSYVLGRVHIDTKNSDSLEPLFEQARRRSKVANDAAALYKETHVPIDAIGKILGIGSIEASRGLRFQSDITLDTCAGTDEERQNTTDRLSGVVEFMVEPVTLSIWQEIGLLPILAKDQRFRIVVVQATIDTLNERAEEARNAIKQEGGSLEVQGEKFVFIEPTAAERTDYADSCSELLAWCRANANLVPTEHSEKLVGQEVEQGLSVASIDTVSTAIERRSAVVIEDHRLRTLGIALGIETASWTQPLLSILRSRGTLQQKEYTGLLAKLVRHRLGFVSIGSDELLVAAERGAESDDFQDLANAVASSRVEARSLHHVAVGFITSLWESPRAESWMRDRLVSEVLERILQRPDGLQLFSAIVRSVYGEIRKFLFPMSLIAGWWAEYVDRFVDGHFIRGVLQSS